MSSNRIAVFLKHQDHLAQAPEHSATRTMCQAVLEDCSGRWIKENVSLKLITDETWRQIKDRLKPAGIKGRLIPRLKAITRQFAIDIYYPEKGRESGRHPHEALLRACKAVRLAQAQEKAAASRDQLQAT